MNRNKKSEETKYIVRGAVRVLRIAGIVLFVVLCLALILTYCVPQLPVH